MNSPDSNAYSMIKRALIYIAAICAAISATAQTDSIAPLRPVTSSYMLEGGSAHLADTYLTPVHYTGEHFGFAYQRMQAMKFRPDRWVMQLKIGISADHTQNPVKNATMWAATLRGSWAMMHRWCLGHGLTVSAGAGASLTGGALYLSRNGNNPVAARASLTLDATGSVGWHGKVMGLPVTARYQPTLPLTGAFFSPDYGELYYQIYLGDHSGLCHAAWPGNYFSFDNLITVDLHLGATALRLGYHNRTFSSKVNNIVSRDISHSFVIGITTEWLSLRPGRRINPDARIISATY